jgi:hypothetical protein
MADLGDRGPCHDEMQKKSFLLPQYISTSGENNSIFNGINKLADQRSGLSTVHKLRLNPINID